MSVPQSGSGDGPSQWQEVLSAALPALAYLGPDPGHALGLLAMLPATTLATAPGPVAQALADAGAQVCLATGPGSSAAELALDLPMAACLSGLGNPPLVVFKTSHRLEETAAARGWRLLAAPAAVGRRWENKVAFMVRAKEMGLPLAAACVVQASDTFAAVAAQIGEDMVLQAPHGFGGARTLRVRDAEEFDQGRAKLRSPQLRASAFVSGPSVTVNACAGASGVTVGPTMVQLTGEPSLTPRELASCGNDWGAAVAMGVDTQTIADLARGIGHALAADGYSGLFGVDFVISPDGRPLVVEVNPRLVASVSPHTQLELMSGVTPLLARHLLAFVGPRHEPAPGPPTQLHGGQVILHALEPGDRLHAGLAPGTYTLAQSRLEWRRPELTLAGLGPDEAVVLPAACANQPEVGAEIGRIQFATGVADNHGRLAPGVLVWVLAAREYCGHT